MGYASPARPPAPAVAALAAAGAAGPIFFGCYALAEYISRAAHAPDMAALPPLTAALGIAVVATIFGAFVAFVPCLIGTTLMARLSRWNPVARLAPVWLIAGAGFILPIAIALPIDDGVAAFAFIATGALCALVARRVTLG